MSALCAYPSLIPSSGAFPSFADIRTSVNGNHYGSYPLSIDTTLRNGYTSRSSFAAQIYPYSTAGTDLGTKTGAADVKSLQQQQQQQQHNSVADALSWQAAVMVQASSAGDRPEPAAKRRCTDKSRNVWPDQVWPSESVSSSSTTTSSSAAAAPSNLCPSGCAMCHQQQQHQQQLQQQQQQQHYHSSVLQLENASHRRPLQERHQNRLFGEEHSQSVVNNNSVIATQSNKSKSDLDFNNTSSMMPQLMLRQSRPLAGVASNNSRQLSVDLKKDYSLPLHVDCSVEYDLPRVVRPPPGAQPLLMLAPRRAPVATVTSATATLVAPAHPMTRESIYQTMVANNGGGTTWNAARAAVNWTTPKNDKLNKSASQSNVMKNIALPVVAPVATPAAPNLSKHFLYILYHAHFFPFFYVPKYALKEIIYMFKCHARNCVGSLFFSKDGSNFQCYIGTVLIVRWNRVVIYKALKKILSHVVFFHSNFFFLLAYSTIECDKHPVGNNSIVAFPSSQ